MAFTHRRIDLKFQLGQGDFGKAGFDTVEVSGLRVTATITRGGTTMSEANLRIFGLSLDVMNKLTILNVIQPYAARRNVITISAGDDSGLSVVFIGNITQAWADFSDMPNAVMEITAHAGYVELMAPVPPTSYKGAVDVATILAGLGTQWSDTPLSLENSGVSVTLTDPYYPGTLLEQVRAVATAGNFNCVIDDVARVLAIWPYGGTRGGQSVVISPETGMRGYPTYTQNGIQLVTLFNPNLTFGTTLDVQSQLPSDPRFLGGSGAWSVATVGHDLESETPGGKWFSRVECGLVGAATPVIQGAGG